MPITVTDKGNARTEAALKRLQQAMAEIEADIVANQGIYPFNHGRVTQSELCRRADVKKATLQNPLHKDTTRVDILAWLDGLSAQLAHSRDASRERVTAVADSLKDEITRLRQDNERLRQQLLTTTAPRLGRSSEITISASRRDKCSKRGSASKSMLRRG